jgi:hypothetical protein
MTVLGGAVCHQVGQVTVLIHFGHEIRNVKHRNGHFGSSWSSDCLVSLTVQDYH